MVEVAMISTKHCLHETAKNGMHEPYIYTHQCCFCGEERVMRGTFSRPQEPQHGLKLRPAHVEVVYENPWMDDCSGRELEIQLELVL